MAERCLVVYDQSYNKEEAVNSVIAKINEGAEGRTPILIVFFANNMQFYHHASKLYEAFSDSTVIGASTGANMSSKGFGPDGLSALVIFEGITVSAGVISDISKYPMRYAKDIAQTAAKMPAENTVCMEFVTSLAACEEIVLDTFKTALSKTGIPMFGASSGAPDDSIMTYVSLNGTVYDEACAYVFIHNEQGRIKIHKENYYKPTIFSFTSTDVDTEHRILYELDDRPAAAFLCDKLGIKRSRLIDYLHNHPMGNKIGDDIFITAAKEVGKDGSIDCYATLYNRTALSIMESEKPRSVWERSRKQIVEEDGIKPNFCIVITCCIMVDNYIGHKLLSEYCNTLNNNYGGFIGMSGKGEQMDFKHLNQSSVIAVFE